MRVLMVQQRFEIPVIKGIKDRSTRLRARCQPNDEISIRVWSGLPYRSKQREILRATCRSIIPICVYKTFDNQVVDLCAKRFPGQCDQILLMGPETPFQIAQDYVEHEGFNGLEELFDWFKNSRKKGEIGLPFVGEVIQWKKK